MSSSSSIKKLDIVYRLRFAYTEDDLDEAADEIERLRGALEFVLEAARWHFDAGADPENTSPDDMTAHVNGLIVKRVREALET